MAEKMKAADASKPKGVPASDLKRIVGDFNRHKSNAAENSGLAGQSIKQAVDQYTLDRKALTIVAGLSKREPVEAQGTIRALMDYADKLGLLDQMDAFDDLVPTLERIVNRAKNVRPSHGVPSGKDGAMGDLMSAGADPVH